MKYIPQYNASKTDDGGYILHTELALEKDYERYATAYGRLEPVYAYLAKAPNPVKYSNWYNLHFPLLGWAYMPDDMPNEYEDMDDEVKHVVPLVERHLLVDRLFESYIYEEGYNQQDWNEADEQLRQELLYRFTVVRNLDQL